MAKTLFLHLGLHKTATTSFQATCAKNREELLRQGILYPLFSCGVSTIAPLDNHSIPLFSLFSKHPERYPVNIRLGINNLDETHQLYRQQLEAAMSSPQDLILSAEDITLLEINEINQLVDFLQRFGCDIVPIAAVRNPYTYHCSQLQQQIKDGTPMVPWHHCPQRDRIKKLDAVFKDDLQYINFEASCNHPQGPVAHLLDTFGINIDTIDITEGNIGRCNDNIRLQNYLNYRQPQLINSEVNPRHIKIAPFTGHKFRLTTQELSHHSPHWDDPSRDATLTEHLEHERNLLETITGLSWSTEQTETREDPLDDVYPIASCALVITIALILQSQHHTGIRSLPIDKIHASLTQHGSNCLRKLQSITNSHLESLIEARERNQHSTPEDELIECGLPDEAVTTLLSIAATWIRRL
ncbi:hypothetical protein SynBOUM118_00441 [Synechococcus sp. BOUM118]|nr:hypothetical protein SynBOUM118_00441 [Synechococcus sp. BOUM118]